MHSPIRPFFGVAVLCTVIVLSGCGDSDASTETSAGGGGGDGTTSGFMSTSATGTGGGSDSFVYAHGPDTLYAIDPITYAVTTVGKFDCVTVADFNSSGEGMLDIAVDSQGRIVGFGAITPSGDHALFDIDATNAHCTAIATYSNADAIISGLSFLPASLAGTGKETLVGLSIGGDYYRIDRTDGTLELVATVAVEAKSPDLVGIEKDGVYVFKGDGNLTKIDGETGAVITMIGEGCQDCGWGVGYWGGRAYGFGLAGTLQIVDVKTGEITPVKLTGDPIEHGFRGAGVTTQAPIIVPE